MRFRDDDRVTVTDPRDRLYNEKGTVTSWFYGMANRVVYMVQLDVRDDALAYAEDQLDLGEGAA